MKNRLFRVLLAVILAVTIFSPNMVDAQQINYPWISPDSTPVRGNIAIIGSTATFTLVSPQSTGVRTYLTGINCINPTATTGLILNILDGNTSIVYKVPCGASSTSSPVYFTPPLKLSAASTVNVGIGTTAVAGYIHIVGFGFTAR